MSCRSMIALKPVSCYDKMHNPARFIYISPGTYQWTCPTCKHKQTVMVPNSTL